MKKLNLLLLMVTIFSLNVQSQDNIETKSKVNVIAYAGIGYGIMENDIEPNYNLNSNNGTILLNYNIWKTFGLASGIGYNKLSGNGFSSEGNFYHERGMIKIPLLFTFESPIAEKFKILGNVGPYTQNVINDEYRYLLTTKKNIYDGWNFGFQIGLGFAYKFDENISFGFNYTGESDFTKLKARDSQIVKDEQKMKNLNTIGFIFTLDF